MTNALQLLDQATIHGLMRAIMESHYNDALDSQQRELTGAPDQVDVTHAKALEISISTLIQDVGNAMQTGELTPFHGNYLDWLKKRGYYQPKEYRNDTETV